MDNAYIIASHLNNVDKTLTLVALKPLWLECFWKYGIEENMRIAEQVLENVIPDKKVT